MEVPFQQPDWHLGYIFTITPEESNTPISPYIYGSNMEKEINSSINLYRMGGNRWSTFNWENNASNGGRDNGHWNGLHLCELQNCNSTEENSPGSVLRKGIQRAFSAGATPIVSIPIGDVVAADTFSEVTENATTDMTPWKYNRPEKTKLEKVFLLIF